MTVRHAPGFRDIEPTFRERVDRIVWCAMAPVDTRGRPAIRLLHPNWEGLTGWIGTYRNSIKRLHLFGNPYASLGCVSDVANPVYVEAIAGFEENPETRRGVWDLFRSNPEPLGYSRERMSVSPNHENFRLLRLDPWKIILATMGGDPWQVVWRKVQDDEADDPKLA